MTNHNSRVGFANRRWSALRGWDGSCFVIRPRVRDRPLVSPLKREVGDEIAVTTRFETDTVNGDHKINHHDEGTRFVEIMHREGIVDLWALKIGDYEEWGEDAGSSRFRETNWMRPFVKDVKGIVGAIPVVSNGRFTDPDVMVVVRHRRLTPRNRSGSTCYHADQRPICGLNNSKLKNRT